MGTMSHLQTELSAGFLPPELEAAASRVANIARAAGGRAVLVGGCVRDALLGRHPKDADVEVFGVSPEELERRLGACFELNRVGKAFGVLKLRGLALDVSVPRRESKAGLGHKGFLIHGDPSLSFKEAAARRDFTLNAISWDPLTRELIDPYCGRDDLAAGILRHTSERFSEDPLRVLRAMQFAGRFAFQVAPETVALCRTIEPEGLPAERLFEEWQKLVVKGLKPSVGLEFLRACGWLRYYPELEALVGCPQDPEWHPEGDVWTHTLHCMDAFAETRLGDEWEDLVVGLAVLCHDLGKPATTFTDTDGHIRSPGHEGAGEAPTLAFLSRLTQHKDLIEAVVPLVMNHMRPSELYRAKAGDSAIRRLALRVGRIDRLVRVDDADYRGRPPMARGPAPQGAWLLDRAAALAVKAEPPRPLVLGRHLIERGLLPGPSFKPLLAECYEAQLSGAFTDLEGGLAFLDALLRDRR